MSKVILEVEKWFNSHEHVEITIKNYVDNFENYSIEKEMFIYEDDIVRERLINTCISSYIKRLEQYIRVYMQDFNFSNYTNYDEFVEDAKDETAIYFLEWFKENNIASIKEFINKSSEKKYNLKHLYSVIKYYDFLIRDSLEKNNYEATLDFLVEFIYNVMSKTSKLTEKEMGKYKSYTCSSFDFEQIDTNRSINKEYLIVNPYEHIICKFNNDFKSAEKQTFLIINTF